MRDFSFIRSMVPTLARDLRRAIANQKAILRGDGRLLIPVARVSIGGVFERVRLVLEAGEWHEVSRAKACNLVVTESINQFLNGMFRSAGAFGNTYIAIGKSAGYTPVATDTMTNIVSDIDEWQASEFDETTRQQWIQDGDSTAGSLTNSASYAEYNISAGVSGLAAQNIILTDNATIRGATGVLVSSAKFSTPDTFNESNKALFGYTFTAADDGS